MNQDEGARPLLSILVPTFERAALLKVGLLSILEQMNGYEGKVELIVSDNASSDNTREVAEWAQTVHPYTYHRNEVNIGAGPNFMLLSNTLAKGEFCWFIGDDDFIRPGALARLVKLLEDNPDVDYFYTNMLHVNTQIIAGLPKPTSSKHFPTDLTYDAKDHEVHRLDKWEDVIDPDRSPVFLGALQSSIFRRRLWVENSQDIGVDKDNFRTMESTYPHAVILTRAMKDRKTMYVGDPLLITGDGARHWLRENPAVAVVRLLDLLRFYESKGVSKKNVRKCRKGILIVYTPYIAVLSVLRNKDRVDYKGSIAPFMGYKEFWLSFLALPFYRMLQRIPRRTD